MRSYSPIKAGHRKQVRKAVTAILEAKRPVFYTGGGIVLSDASEGLTRLVERLNVPITNTLMGLGGISGEHSNFVGMLGMHGAFEANKTMANADVIVALGARFDDRVTNNVKKFCPNATIVHVDVDPTVISKTVNAHIPVVGSVERVIEQIQSEIDKRDPQELDAALSSRQQWWQQINTWRQRMPEKYQASSEVIKPQSVVETLYEVTNGDAYICADVGQHQMFAAQYYPFKRPRQWINSGGLGTMGFGFPAAMGVQLAFPDAVSVCVTGDGSIQMNIQELATCLQYGIPVKIISLNNQALGMVRQWQDMIYNGRHSHSYMDSLPDFVKLVEAYGHVGMRVEHPSELKSTLEKAFELKDRLVFVDVLVDQSEHVYPMQVRHGAVDEMWLRKGERA
jgi:acetolactate synthase-1/2/3 large subunit